MFPTLWDAAYHTAIPQSLEATNVLELYQFEFDIREQTSLGITLYYSFSKQKRLALIGGTRTDHHVQSRKCCFSIRYRPIKDPDLLSITTVLTKEGIDVTH